MLNDNSIKNKAVISKAYILYYIFILVNNVMKMLYSKIPIIIINL